MHELSTVGKWTTMTSIFIDVSYLLIIYSDLSIYCILLSHVQTFFFFWGHSLILVIIPTNLLFNYYTII